MKLNVVFLLVVISSSLYFNSCSNTANPTDFDANKLLTEKLDIIGDSITSKVVVNGKNISAAGAVIGVYNPGSNFGYLKGFGKSDISNNTLMDRHTEIKIGTLTQSFMATLALQLVEEKLIALEDPISKYIQVPHSGSSIKITHLLTNRSAIADFIDSVRFYHLTEPNRKFSETELINFAFSQSENFKPGGTPKLSNTNYLLLGLIIEKVTKDNLQNLITNRILKPLNLKNTFFNTNSSFNSNQFSKGYIYTDTTGYVDVTSKTDYSWAWATSNMTSNSEDLIDWVKYLTDGTLISRASQTNMQLFEKLHNRDNLDYYLGMGIMRIGSFIGYSSEIDGYYTSLYYLPSKQTIIYIFTNSQNKNDNLMVKIAQLVFPGLKAN